MFFHLSLSPLDAQMLFAIVSAALIGAFVGWYFYRKSSKILSKTYYLLFPSTLYKSIYNLFTDQRKKVPIEQRKYKVPPDTFLQPKVNPKTNLLCEDSKIMLFKNIK